MGRWLPVRLATGFFLASGPNVRQGRGVTQNDQQAAFESDLLALIRRYENEFNLTVASCVGTMEVVKAMLIDEAIKKDDE
jgi:hypothetical protein